MDFKSPYLHAMREKAPRQFNQLVRSGRMDEHLQAKSKEAHQLLEQILAGEKKEPNGVVSNPAAQHRAEEEVLAQMLQWEEEKKPERAEPPDDLPTRASQIRT